MDTFINWVVNSPEKSLPALGAALGLVLGGLWTALTFFQKVLVEKEQRQFERYHHLIDQLNRGIKGDVRVDFQLNAVYELRFFRKYYPRSERIVELLIPRWIESSSYNDDNVDELRATLSFIRWRKSIIGTVIITILNIVWPWWK
ncbi:hypothetical protein EKS35_03895 [Enterobacter hormaechei subsp. steigerwaltii]|uniref:hypothetical protein n=1 Tax=Enterobacter hormaechei TaxID=158836 RepID=UPI000F81F481|nr:hypothetical protein [Enterobacter hormaechei]MED5635822.1 hypothetical protein [Enterobacter hormaechei]RTY47462.1 hypothetical protein EKS35_03895 [Enterobacter hormaechei subsp. steigerwaltii]HBN5482085.1 hypothetical protein [Enterobacter hormaechei]HBV5205503.1 hypothetical protein [Enterobacter hormaechei]